MPKSIANWVGLASLSMADCTSCTRTRRRDLGMEHRDLARVGTVLCGRELSIIVASTIVAFTCALPGCVTLAQKPPEVLPQDKSIDINGYTTKDGIRHACLDCKARFVSAPAPDGTGASFVVISAPGATQSNSCDAAFAVWTRTPSKERWSTENINAADVTSIEFKQTNYAGLYVALGVIAVGGLLFLGWAIGMNKATSH